MVTTCNQLLNYYKIDTVFSHQETGLLITYTRDKDFTRYCRNNSIHWIENNNNGVLRGLLNRNDWFDKWDEYMYQICALHGLSLSFSSPLILTM